LFDYEIPYIEWSICTPAKFDEMFTGFGIYQTMIHQEIVDQLKHIREDGCCIHLSLRDSSQLDTKLRKNGPPYGFHEAAKFGNYFELIQFVFFLVFPSQ